MLRARTTPPVVVKIRCPRDHISDSERAVWLHSVEFRGSEQALKVDEALGISPISPELLLLSCLFVTVPSRGRQAEDIGLVLFTASTPKVKIPLDGIKFKYCIATRQLLKNIPYLSPYATSPIVFTTPSCGPRMKQANFND